MKRPYTGNKDGAAAGEHPQLTALMKELFKAYSPALWNNGSFGIRSMRGKESLSVHATGRAWDASYRKSERHPNASRKGALTFIDIVVANANTLGVECILDYMPEKFGRAWRCDRQAWKKYSKPTIHGAPGGDWFHIEITPQAADSVIFVKAAFLKVFGEIPPKA